MGIAHENDDVRVGVELSPMSRESGHECQDIDAESTDKGRGSTGNNTANMAADDVTS